MNALLGATLIDLQELLQSDIQEISAVFTWRLAIFNFGITRIVKTNVFDDFIISLSTMKTKINLNNKN